MNHGEEYPALAIKGRQLHRVKGAATPPVVHGSSDDIHSVIEGTHLLFFS